MITSAVRAPDGVGVTVAAGVGVRGTAYDMNVITTDAAPLATVASSTTLSAAAHRPMAHQTFVTMAPTPWYFRTGPREG
jgi:hypothetical protein